MLAVELVSGRFVEVGEHCFERAVSTRSVFVTPKAFLSVSGSIIAESVSLDGRWLLVRRQINLIL
ncbi:MAG: hypothetical protein MI864_04980 [Pseudomonadales bacterium]|nr:hypothetical protein [Pseudomonadales bacterium]